MFSKWTVLVKYNKMVSTQSQAICKHTLIHSKLVRYNQKWLVHKVKQYASRHTLHIKNTLKNKDKINTSQYKTLKHTREKN